MPCWVIYGFMTRPPLAHPYSTYRRMLFRTFRLYCSSRYPESFPPVTSDFISSVTRRASSDAIAGARFALCTSLLLTHGDRFSYIRVHSSIWLAIWDVIHTSICVSASWLRTFVIKSSIFVNFIFSPLFVPDEPAYVPFKRVFKRIQRINVTRSVIQAYILDQAFFLVPQCRCQRIFQRLALV